MKHYPLLIQEASASQEKQKMLCDSKMNLERKRKTESSKLLRIWYLNLNN